MDQCAGKWGRISSVGRLGEGEGEGEGGAAGGAAAFGKTLVKCVVPLREMVGYSTALRSQTRGEGSFSMTFAEYAPVGEALQRKILKNPALL